MNAVARTWDEGEPGTGVRRVGAVTGTRNPESGAQSSEPRGTAATPLRPVPRREPGLQLPLIREDEALRDPPGPDRPPELTHYRDEGCRFWAACLSCPFPRCLYEDPGGARRALNIYRDGEIRRMYDAGVRAVEIAAHFAMPRRSVYRALGGVRRRAGNRESGVGNRERPPKTRAHLPHRERPRLSTPDSRLPRT